MLFEEAVTFVLMALIVLKDLAAPWLYFRWTRRHQTKRFRTLLILKPVTTAVGLIFLLRFFGSGMGAGALYALALIPLTVLALVGALIWAVRSPAISKPLIILGLLLSLSTALPALAWVPAKHHCAVANSSAIPQLASAVQNYRLINGRYPESVTDVSPTLPVPTCNWLASAPQDFQLLVCEDGQFYFYADSVDGMGFEYYSAEGAHFSQWSFLDGAPNVVFCNAWREDAGWD